MNQHQVFQLFYEAFLNQILGRDFFVIFFGKLFYWFGQLVFSFFLLFFIFEEKILELFVLVLIHHHCL